MAKGEKIKNLRKELKMSQVELAKKIGVSKQTLYKYENDIITNIPSDKIMDLSNVLHTSPAYLMGWTDDKKIDIKKDNRKSYVQGTFNKGFKSGKIPLLGAAPCGTPITAIENLDIDDYVEIEEALARTGEYFALRAKGISMLPRIEEGDIMIVHQQPDIESGQVAIVRVNGEEATCKRIKKYHGGIELVSINPSYEPMFFDWEDVENKPVEILGRVIEVRSKL